MITEWVWWLEEKKNHSMAYVKDAIESVELKDRLFEIYRGSRYSSSGLESPYFGVNYGITAGGVTLALFRVNTPIPTEEDIKLVLNLCLFKYGYFEVKGVELNLGERDG